MSNLELAEPRLTFDDLLEAVQDSRRGRWFLQEYESRIQKRDTQSILSAISKLENRMEQLGPQSENPGEMSKVRNAISNARNDLFKLGLGKEAMSKEGRLFAELADMARKAIPESPDQSAGIVRTLQLVDEIDRTISPAAAQDNGSKFFAADSNLFDRAPVTKPVLVETATQAAPATEAPKPIVEAAKPAAPAKAEPVPTGAKLVIRKAGAAVQIEPPAPVATDSVVEAAQPAVAAQPSMPTSEMPKPTIQATDNPRIVIIRRKAEDMPEVSVGEVSAA